MHELTEKELENINGGGLWDKIEQIGSLALGIKAGIERGGSVDFLPWAVFNPAERQAIFNPTNNRC